MNLPTQAKDLAITFHKLTDKEMSRNSMSKSVSIFKKLLAKYSFDELIFAMNLFIRDKEVGVYSPGFFLVSTVMEEAKQKYDELEAHRKRQEEHEAMSKNINLSGDSSARNRKRASKSHTSSRRGKKYNLDMFE